MYVKASGPARYFVIKRLSLQNGGVQKWHSSSVVCNSGVKNVGLYF